MIPFDSFEILVVGAGPAGCCAAAAAARAGVTTVLIDAKSRIGELPHCGEFIPRRLFQEYRLSSDCIVQSVDRMETRITDLSDFIHCANDGNGALRIATTGFRAGVRQVSSAGAATTVQTDSPGFMIDRTKFDRTLARDAAAAGATVLASTRLMRREKGHWIIKYDGEEVGLRPRMVVAADGALSTVASRLGMKRPEILSGRQVEAPLSHPLDRTLVFLDQCFIGGYGWLFPKGNVANVGIGMRTGSEAHPRNVLDALLEMLVMTGVIRPGRLASSSGVIPVSGLRRSLVEGNVIFCGDAAGLTHPITGAGVPQAVFSGCLAGNSAAAAIKTGEKKPLHDYETEIRGRYAGVLRHALAKRTVMTSRWKDPDFASTCKHAWIAFKEYRRRVR